MNTKLATLPQRNHGNATPTGHLRIMETTDLHMHILDYDYFADRPDKTTGLIRLANKIAALRAEPHVTSLLMDNGDFLQGNPLADYIATHSDDDDTHPMIAAMNVLGYDALALGNHEFDYGIPFLRGALADAQFPITCANLRLHDGPQIAQPYAILAREITCSDGVSRPIKIGVVGFLPPHVSHWNPDKLGRFADTTDIVDCAKQIVPQLKAEGADVVVALCHSGIGSSDHVYGMENAAVPLAAVDGIDVILTGHTHEFFPAPDRKSSTPIDPIAGTLHGKPTVMPGFYGSRLGVVDLTVSWHNSTWVIKQHSSRLAKGDPGLAPESALPERLREEVVAAHSETLAHIREPIAETKNPLHSYFTTIGTDLSQRLLGQAQRAHVIKALTNTPYETLPVISATAPYLFGGWAGPGHYIDISSGPIARRDAAAIFPFADKLCAVRRTGAELRNWIERAASHYLQIAIGKHDQPLINACSPGYNCDVLHGLSYEIDPSQPARFDVAGVLIDATHSRVRNLTYHGKAVNDNDVFIVAANRYRINGGGGYARCPDVDLLYTSKDSVREILVQSFQQQDGIDLLPPKCWKFSHLKDTSGIFTSAPAAQRYATGSISHVGPGDNGFDLYRFTF
ncbi:bifunctional 2',3'-cyclic-nucleotide 2'-phosphodiesterase/3'-nucleotidase [Yoonia maritima]|uniref:bifunctional 2',3'-cyclic-nucleotide 2'-phosphodiesterase/3'-nucleotidase n=1 Tax=Yoonia maritima TaxID=1435347 RepID=UPI000D0F7245|nr:bifunctional 2',3'-cyclic-nucleotide 2'-phosphodiesterase/3'-nucleotidase [Yoonia maritima]